MIVQRQKYLNQLIAGQGNGLVKIVTGGRRCGKSFLLFNLFHNYLIEQGVSIDHIIELSFDDIDLQHLTKAEALVTHVKNLIVKDGKTTYVILDEIQLVDGFVGVLLSLMHVPNVEIYVSGSNSKFLSKDVVTEFRGRGDEIRVWPLSFAEYYEVVGGDKMEVWNEFVTYGSLPQILHLTTEEKKIDYLRNLYELTYLRDVIDRNHLRNEEGMRQLVQVLASSIGAPTNPRRISNTFRSAENVILKDATIKDYIGYLQDAFLIEECLRYDVKGRKYIGTETKYYFEDMGLRNIILNFRQNEQTHLMENVIYNELRMRGFLVDVGMVQFWQEAETGNQRKQLEVDFVVNRGSQRYYIQSAFAMYDEAKREQEMASLRRIPDAFKRVIIVRDYFHHYHNDEGFLILSLFDFLLNPDSLNW